MKEFWSYNLDDILKRLKTNKAGLSSKEAEERIDKYGQNIFEEKKGSNGKGMDVVGRNCTWLCKAT